MGLLDSVTGFVSNAWDTVKDFVGGSSSNGGGRDYGGSSYSSSSSTVTNYDPDKVEVAKLENERVDLVKNAQLELMEVNARLEAVMIEARCKGFQSMQISMMSMLREVNQLAEERLVLLENGSQEQVQKVEAMYADLSKDMENDDFMFSKVPQMLEIANKFPEESDSRKLYMSGIDREMAKHFDFKTEQLKKLNERCQIVIASVVTSKEKMQSHIDMVITKRIEHIEQVMHVNAQLPYSATAQIGDDDQLKIEHKS
ncbi:hypothetical protein EXU29_14205 [Acinetobacter wuhouensis]|uniref:hypothetical protein n=1 Tax=Acinetobacter wuhouensis TaxID=1879050 RepID=UPI0010238491|nr:hypothetical protein [Acinetobacter wuhouensis]RZG71403.1 hypothetical protein EXU29_14205 [Acinetobacter wuhouensis]